jgi:hypothetical protein
MMALSRRRIFEETHNRGNQLDPDLTTDLNIHLNAFYLNLCGALDNLAWMLAYNFGLLPNLSENQKKHRSFCNLFGTPFLSSLEQRLPDLIRTLREYQSWNRDIRKFRDPAAHRIPLYAPPGIHTDDTTPRRVALERQASEVIQKRDSHTWLTLQMEIRGLATYMPMMIASESTGLELHLLQGQIPQDQAAFLKISTAVLHETLGPFTPHHHWDWIEDDDQQEIEFE